MFSTINSGISAAAQALSVSANNFANSNTVGFKHSTVNFSDVFANNPSANPKTAVGLGAQTASVDRQMSQGALTSTGRITDLAIAGTGFFTLGSAESLIKPPPYVTITKFNGTGLTAATWPQVPEPPVYPPIGPLNGSGLQSAAWATKEPALETSYNGDGLPALNTNVLTGLPAGTYILKVNRANDTLDLILDGTTVKTYTFNDFNHGSDWLIGNLGPVQTFDFSTFLNDEGSDGEIFNMNIVVDGHQNGAEYTYTISKNNTDLYSANFYTYQRENGTITNSYTFQTDAYSNPQNPGTVSSPINWASTNFQGISKNVFVRNEGSGIGTNAGFIGKPSYISFGGSGTDGERSLVFDTMDLSNTKSIKFDYIAGSRANGGDTPGPGEQLELLYSTDNGITFQSLWASTEIPPADTWQNYEVTLPAGAKSVTTIIKFVQLNSSGKGNDTHGLSNITFTPDELSEPETTFSTSSDYQWTDGTLGGKASNAFRRLATSNPSNDNGGFGGISEYIVFGSSGTAGKRYFEISDLDLTHGQSIGLSLRRGNDQNGAELPDSPDENLNLSYSSDGGVTYHEFKTFSASDTGLSDWTTLSLSLPAGAKSSPISIRFEQQGSSGPEYDHWGLANINFQMASPITVEPTTNNALPSTTATWTWDGRAGTAQNVYLTQGETGNGNNAPFDGRDEYISFGGDGQAGQRILTLPSLDLRGKRTIDFDVIKGSGTNGGDTSNVGENFLVEYSTDNGLTYRLLSNLSNKSSSFVDWAGESIALPPDARQEDVTFRFRQEGSSGPQYDHWGITNIGFSDTDFDSIKRQGRAFTRAGNFILDKDGYLKTSNDLHVIGKNLKTSSDELEAVQIPGEMNGHKISAIDINNDGVITASYSNGSVVPLFSLAIASFSNQAGLKPIGFTNFVESNLSGKANYIKPSSSGSNIMSGTLEQSTTDVTAELVLMMKAQQAFSSNSRALQTYMEMASRLTDDI